MNRTEVINFLVSKFSYKKYREIGVQPTHQSFDHINVPAVIHFPGLKDLKGYVAVTSDFEKDIPDIQTALTTVVTKPNGSSAT